MGAFIASLGPPAVGAGDPDLLAAQVLAQRLEGDDLVDHPHDALAAVLASAVDQRLPVLGDPGVGRDVFPGGVAGQAARSGVPVDQRPGPRLPAGRRCWRRGTPGPRGAGSARAGSARCRAAQGLHGAPVGGAGGTCTRRRGRAASSRPPPGTPRAGGQPFGELAGVLRGALPNPRWRRICARWYSIVRRHFANHRTHAAGGRRPRRRPRTP